MRLTGVSIGSIHRLMPPGCSNRDLLISMVRSLFIDAIEIHPGDIPGLLGLQLDPTNREWLAALPYVSLHAPGLGAANHDGLVKQKMALDDFCSTCRVDTVVFHPYQLPPQELLPNQPRPAVENLGKTAKDSDADLHKALRDDPRLGFCFDLSHAMSMPLGEAAELVELYRDRICQVHISGFARGSEHSPIVLDDGCFMDAFSLVAELQVPFIVETDTSDLRSLARDVERVRALIRTDNDYS